MQQQFKSAAFTWMVIIIAGITLFSFSSPSGGDRFEVYLNKKLIFQEFVHLSENKKVKTFQLNRNNLSGQIDVVYSHCGQAGKNRSIKITNSENQVVREWNFGNGKDHNATMNFQVKDLLLAEKAKSAEQLNLYYASEQIPNGKLLASITLVNNNATP